MAAKFEIKKGRMMKLKIATALMLFTFIGCSTASAERQKAASIKQEISNIESQISEAEKENDKYTGGLVKALIESRLQTLKQTHAMLQQRDSAWTFGIKMNYTVDGKAFVLPDGAKQLLPDIKREIAENNRKIAEQEKTVSLYSGGLVQALSISTLETMRQTQAMLEQRRLAIEYELPQYLSFQKHSSKP